MPNHLHRTTTLPILFGLQDASSPPTLPHSSNGKLLSPDLMMVSGNIYQTTSFRVLGDIGGDHMPTLVHIDMVKARRKGKSRVNRNNEGASMVMYIKANWPAFKEATGAFEKAKVQEASINTAYKNFTKAILVAACKAVPRSSKAGSTSLSGRQPLTNW